MCQVDPRLNSSLRVVEEDQVSPTRLDLTFVYIPGALTSTRSIWVS